MSNCMRRAAYRIGLIALLLVCVPMFASAEPACVLPQSGGIGGTGMLARHDGGIGGTGVRAEGGIGGTGIVGTITGFASVCVNGLEVHYEISTPVSSNGRDAVIDQLAIGQVVSIEALPSPRGLEAVSIALIQALEGHVSQVYPAAGLFYVLGQPVKVGAETRFAGVGAYEEIVRGMSVSVSGYRNAAGTVIASRVEAVNRLDEISVVGDVVTQAGRVTVGGLPVLLKGDLPASGTELLVRGSWDGEHVVAREARSDPSLLFAGRVEHIVAEGIVLNREGTRRLSIGGFKVGLSAKTSVTGGELEKAQIGQRVRVSGRLGTGRLVHATHVEFMRDMGMGSGRSGRINPQNGGRGAAGQDAGNEGMWTTPGNMAAPGGPNFGVTGPGWGSSPSSTIPMGPTGGTVPMPGSGPGTSWSGGGAARRGR